MPQTVYSSARKDLSAPQERNRTWWEALPMTYKEWDADDRTTSGDTVVSAFLDGNPWLSPNYFLQFAGKSVLDIGCGAGPAGILFARGGARVTAIDLTYKAVELTRKHTEGLGVAVERMDAEELTFPDKTFDHVFSWGVLHHSAQPERAFAQVARVLKPGGTGLIMVYNRASLRYWLKGLMWLLLRGRIFSGETLSTVQYHFTDGFYHRHYTAAELVKALAPLRVTAISVTHMKKKMIPMIPVSLDERLKRRFGWLLIAEFVRD